MGIEPAILFAIRRAASRAVLFLPHAVKQMARADRMISPSDVRAAIANGKLIEDYPEDVRGHSALIRGFDKFHRPIHVVCAPKEEFLAIITAYVPDDDVWSDNWTRRRTK